LPGYSDSTWQSGRRARKRAAPSAEAIGPHSRDTLYIQMAVEIEWDENKNRANITKHGVDFAVAASVFDDPLSLTIPDRVTDGERRYRTIGAALSGVIIVAYTLRELSESAELVRIISAR